MQTVANKRFAAELEMVKKNRSALHLLHDTTFHQVVNREVKERERELCVQNSRISCGRTPSRLRDLTDRHEAAFAGPAGHCPLVQASQY